MNHRHNSKYGDDSLQGIYLRQRLIEFSHSMEEELTKTIEKHLKIWKDENLAPAATLDNLKRDENLAPATTLGNLKSASFTNLSLTKSNDISKSSSSNDGQLPSRIFIARPSLLSELLNVNHIRSIYNIFVAILFLLFINKALEELVQTGSINFGFSFIYWAFGHFDRVIIIWLCMKVSTIFVIYLCFHYWSYNRQKAPRLYDVTASLLYFIYLYLFLQMPVQYLLCYQLPPASSFIILSEQVRLFMKTWAFVRSNIPRSLHFKKDDSVVNSSPCPNFSQYLYFLFVPTLVYRDEYPRNKSCNWRKVAKEFGQVLGCILYTHFIFARFCIPVFEQFGRDKFSKSNLMVAVFSSCFPGSLVLLCGFFAVLHAWMNAFAEMLRFSDRMFYKDWWNSTSYPRFYRTWNCIIHDWLYEYVFKELCDLQMTVGGLFQRLKFFPMLVVFFISSVVHEYIIAFAFRFFYPVLLVMFGGFGVLLMFFNTKAKQFNIFLWISLILGTGILMCLYSIEWYARINCAPVRDGIADLFIPRSWFC